MMSAKIVESKGLRCCGVVIAGDIFDFHCKRSLGNDDQGGADADDDDCIHGGMSTKNLMLLLPNQATVVRSRYSDIAAASCKTAN